MERFTHLTDLVRVAASATAMRKWHTVRNDETMGMSITCTKYLELWYSEHRTGLLPASSSWMLQLLCHTVTLC